MAEQTQPKALIIGAGSMGILTGYHLQRAGASVAFLIRPHRAEALSRPQILYSYDDHTAKEYKGYSTITDPADIDGSHYDWVIITLDGASFRNETGQALTKTLGAVFRGTTAKFLLGSPSFKLLPWFLETSGLPKEQVTNGYMYIHAYSPAAVTLPLHPPTNAQLLATADQAYTDKLGLSFVLDDNSAPVADAFKTLWDKAGASPAAIQKADDLAVSTVPFWTAFAVVALLEWPAFADINAQNETWKLGVEAAREILGLSLYGEKGIVAQKTTTAEGFLELVRTFEKNMYPLDLQAFNRYHHGGKVHEQDMELLRLSIEEGEKEGKGMPALKELIKRSEVKEGH